MEQLPQNITEKKSQNELRLLPLAVAALTCFVVAVTSGYVLWYLLGSKSPRRAAPVVANANTNPIVIPAPAKPDEPAKPAVNANTAPANPAPQPVEPEKPAPLAPAGELTVPAMEMVMGGGDTQLPLRRQFVEEFAIAETEVTNRQFKEFLEVTESKIPKPTGKDDEPVTNVSWSEAKLYCDWLSRKLGVEVRLPTEAEWELAARGAEAYKYPWGNEWKDEAAVTKENQGKVQAVKSFPLNKSPFGAFDMAGNVWEWTADAVRDTERIKMFPEYKNVTWRVAKGGAVTESKVNISSQSRDIMPGTERFPNLGFRYVVVRKKPAPAEKQTN